MWCRYERMNIIRFLSSVGRNLRMGRMLGRHSVKSRIESEAGLSLTEFTYQASLCSTLNTPTPCTFTRRSRLTTGSTFCRPGGAGYRWGQ